MSTEDTGRTGVGTGVLILAALGTLIGLLFLANSRTDEPGTGHDPVTINLPKTVEHKHRLGSSVYALGEPDDMVTQLSAGGLTSSGPTDLRQDVYGDPSSSAGVWVVAASRNYSGRVGSWLADNAPSGQGITVTHPRLPIAGNTACYRQQDGRSMCTWYDENYFLLVTGLTDPDSVQQVLLRVYAGAEA
ncbi:hypothetical protein ACFZB9_19030 [Kitasatospora sp. NPDC008050]|uniref:hypothetical protein n=1 Tax=Kitasatospora sp. NPDC008050 TaxID=3364021 RepID=UPI0036ED54EA